jgi:hypothetical protein
VDKVLVAVEENVVVMVVDAEVAFDDDCVLDPVEVAVADTVVVPLDVCEVVSVSDCVVVPVELWLVVALELWDVVCVWLRLVVADVVPVVDTVLLAVLVIVEDSHVLHSAGHSSRILLATSVSVQSDSSNSRHSNGSYSPLSHRLRVKDDDVDDELVTVVVVLVGIVSVLLVSVEDVAVFVVVEELLVVVNVVEVDVDELVRTHVPHNTWQSVRIG